MVLDWKKIVSRYIIETTGNQYTQHDKLKTASNSLTVLLLRTILTMPLNMDWPITALSHRRERKWKQKLPLKGWTQN